MGQNNDSHGTGHIVQSLVINFMIACAKGFAAFMTGSGAMLAETIHSFSDCANQGLLLLGVRQGRKAPDEKHPLGYGRAVYFWSFMVAMLLFSLGGLFSIYEGIHKFMHPEAPENVSWGIGILFFSLLLEGYATYSNIVEFNARRGSTGFFQYLKETKDSGLVVVFGENSAAVLGLILALLAMIISYYTNDGRYDAIGTFLIGVVLIGVAVFLAREVMSLLIGESADDEVTKIASKIAIDHPLIQELINIITVQQGPGEVLACAKIKCEPHLTAAQISVLINDFENQLRTACPEVKWLYVEPDLQEWM
jgi:cation diffusion facilitator family transporter